MKKVIALSAVAFLSTSIYANSDIQAQLDELKAKIKKLEKKQASQQKKISAVNKLANNDNLKFNVDFRTTYDYIKYTTVSGKAVKNNGLYANRLILGMGYAPGNDLIFKGEIVFNKAFGASTPGQRGAGYDTFDWIVNENLTDDKLRLREAYWVWTPTLGDRGYTFSIGRRPATNGYLANMREDDKAKSPIGHIINMEFDGLSVSMKTDDMLEGSYVKLCLGRGLTNANARFTQAGTDYAKSTTALDEMDLVGVIFKAYDDGQYSMMTKYYRGFNVIGNKIYGKDGKPLAKPVLTSYGDMDGAAISAKVEGVGEEISDFLDETKLFASLAWSKTRPKNGQRMLGSASAQSGTSILLGAQMPNLTGGKFGVEYNHGSKYWRSFTYGEDTMIGSKMAARGDAYEMYWNQPLLDEVLSMQVRYTYIKYKYTGSNAFFGDGGTPMTMSAAKAAGMDPVEKARDIRVFIRYRY